MWGLGFLPSLPGSDVAVLHVCSPAPLCACYKVPACASPSGASGCVQTWIAVKELKLTYDSKETRTSIYFFFLSYYGRLLLKA